MSAIEWTAMAIIATATVIFFVWIAVLVRE
jgi:hypothetical protein